MPNQCLAPNTNYTKYDEHSTLCVHHTLICKRAYDLSPGRFDFTYVQTQLYEITVEGLLVMENKKPAIVVAGACGALGGEIVLEALRRTWPVLALCRNDDLGDKLRQKVTASKIDKHACRIVSANLAQPKEVSRLLDDAQDEFGRFGGLVHAAGRFHFGPAGEAGEELYQELSLIHI